MESKEPRAIMGGERGGGGGGGLILHQNNFPTST